VFVLRLPLTGAGVLHGRLSRADLDRRRAPPSPTQCSPMQHVAKTHSAPAGSVSIPPPVEVWLTGAGMLSIRDVDPQGADATALLREASIEAQALYPELFASSEAPAATNGPLPERGVYVVAYLDGLPAACGALRPLDASVAEVRRMYVRRDHRRKGLASAVLSHLVDRSRRLGYRGLVLETGYKQIAAMRLYEVHGFQRIPTFGVHLNGPTSVCYGRSFGEA